MNSLRQSAVAGTFYPADPAALSSMVETLLGVARAERSSLPSPPDVTSPDITPNAAVPKAIIAPHAGYAYSGIVAARAYASLAAARDRIKRVVILGPAHHYPLKGLALSSAAAFVTPFGQIPCDAKSTEILSKLPQVQELDAAHSLEHSIEVQLPFLQKVLDKFTLVALAVGDATTDDISEVLAALWGGRETLIVISSDLSHHLPYTEAKNMDTQTQRIIEAMDPALIGRERACGRVAMRGLLGLARVRRMRIETVDLCNSGDTSGDKDAVVGYGAWHFYEEDTNGAKT
ncbi:AmmeMemoRadiSam system protein B [Varunaivibrio sulfuroxidans]|uniref:MEMO1 family protein EDD55_11186 n=1 Tax=Varunaivibrio sulfuroxidans TaxID=1773489 RepID=A0A4R3J504_9PROT|nr:AmmeMemoRadiSam system protein B [Varunaivibrio sulfuroxidans]TCS60385.1 hypothetical protein EDD55_11186 [Varunaivibrio sulfuroxidans]WES30928.1 AmmeMemoRadiSam system protein B [Varunaivibrio sulfuroxidans]